MLDLWVEEFDAALSMTGCFVLVCHPRYSGRPARLLQADPVPLGCDARRRLDVQLGCALESDPLVQPDRGRHHVGRVQRERRRPRPARPLDALAHERGADAPPARLG